MANTVTTRVLMRRKFDLLDVEGNNVDIEANLHAHGSQTPSFSFSVRSRGAITHSLEGVIVPDDIRADIEALSVVASHDENGVPMHAVANAAYHLREGRFRDAHRTLTEIGEIGLIYAIHDAVEQELTGAETFEQTRAEITRTVQRLNRAVQAVRDGTSYFGVGKQWKAQVADLANKIGRHPAKFGEAEIVELAASEQKVREATRAAIAHLRKPKFEKAVADHVERLCAPVWRAQAEAAKAALGGPDYRAADRAAPADDPTTWDGFIANWGLSMSTSGPVVKGEQLRWTCTFRGCRSDDLGPNGDLEVDFGWHISRGSAPPDMVTVLEALQTDFSTNETYSLDEYIREMGMPDTLSGVRDLEHGFALIGEQAARFKEITGGDEAYRSLLTSVGFEAPLSRDYFQDHAPTP